MRNEELFSSCCQYLEDVLTYEESRSMGIDGFHKYVKEHIVPIPKSELVIGKEYPGHCRNSGRAIWNGKSCQYIFKILTAITEQLLTTHSNLF